MKTLQPGDVIEALELVDENWLKFETAGGTTAWGYLTDGAVMYFVPLDEENTEYQVIAVDLPY